MMNDTEKTMLIFFRNRDNKLDFSPAISLADIDEITKLERFKDFDFKTNSNIKISDKSGYMQMKKQRRNHKRECYLNIGISSVVE